MQRNRAEALGIVDAGEKGRELERIGESRYGKQKQAAGESRRGQ